MKPPDLDKAIETLFKQAGECPHPKLAREYRDMAVWLSELRDRRDNAESIAQYAKALHQAQQAVQVLNNTIQTLFVWCNYFMLSPKQQERKQAGASLRSWLDEYKNAHGIQDTWRPTEGEEDAPPTEVTE